MMDTDILLWDWWGELWLVREWESYGGGTQQHSDVNAAASIKLTGTELYGALARLLEITIRAKTGPGTGQSILSFTTLVSRQSLSSELLWNNLGIIWSEKGGGRPNFVVYYDWRQLGVAGQQIGQLSRRAWGLKQSCPGSPLLLELSLSN